MLLWCQNWLLAYVLLLLARRSNGDLELVRTTQNFLFYFDIVELSDYHPWQDIESSILAQYAFEAYEAMLRSPRLHGHQRKPLTMAALW